MYTREALALSNEPWAGREPWRPPPASEYTRGAPARLGGAAAGGKDNLYRRGYVK